LIRLLTLAAFLLVPSAAFQAPEGKAPCSCGVDLVRAAHEGRPVFEGTVTRVVFVEVEDTLGMEPPIIVDFDVAQSWGREVPDRFTLHTHFNGMDCEGYWFEEGKTYLLFAYRNDDARSDRWHPTWPPAETYGTLYCGVHEGERAEALVQRLLREVGVIRGAIHPPAR
jgi:hypothetical protein